MSSASLGRVASRLFLVFCGFCLLLASAASARAAGVATQVYIGNTGNLDASVGLNPLKDYINAVNVNGTALSINGVAFAAGNNVANNPSGTGLAGTAWWIGGNGNAYGGGGTTNYSGQLANLTNVFDYGATSGTIGLTGLTPGQTYTFTLYQRAWDGNGNRKATITTSDGATFVNDVDFGDPTTGGSLNLMRYTFVATSGTETLVDVPQTGNTMHMYGFSTEQNFFNTTSGSGSSINWSALPWTNTQSSGTTTTPSGSDSNASFTLASAPTTINITSPTTLGYLQFAGSNSYTLSGSTLTMQADVGGTALLNAVGGSHTISTPIVLNTSTAQLGSGTMTLSGAISGSGQLAVGGGLLVLSGSDSYTGGTIVNGGILQFASAAPSSGTIQVNNGGILQVASGATVGSGKIQITTGGALALGGLYPTAAAWLTSGVISTASTGVVALTANDNSALNFSSYSYLGLGSFGSNTFSGTIVPGSGGYVLGDGAGNLTLTTTLSGANALTVAGNVTLTAANTLTGATNVTSGTLDLMNPSALQNSTVVPKGGTVTFDSSVSPAAFTFGGLSGAGSLVLQTNAASPSPVALTVGGNNATTTFSGALSGSGSLVKAGTAGLTLSGGNITYTGSTSVSSGGTLTLLNTSAFKSGAVADNGTLVFAPVSGNMFAGSPGYNSVISGAGGVVVNGINPNYVGIGGVNTYSGGTTVNQGKIYVYNASGLGTGTVTISGSSSVSFWTTSAVTIPNNFVLSTLGMTNTLSVSSGSSASNDALFGDGNAGGSYTLSGSITLNANSSIGAYGSDPVTITGRVGGASELFINALRTDTNNGTVTLANTNNSYAGGTYINWGTLISANPGALQGSATVANGAYLGLGADGDGSGVPNLAATYTNVVTFSGTSGGFWVGHGGFGMPYLSNLWTQAANKYVNFGQGYTFTNFTLNVTNANGYGLNLTGPLTLAGSTDTISEATATASNVIQGLTLSGVVSGSGLIKAGAGTLVLTNTANNFTAPITIGQGVLSVDANAALETNNQSIVLNPTTGTSTLRVTGNLSLGNNVLTLATTANTSAVEVPTGGTLTLGSLTVSAAPTATLTKNDNGTLVLAGTNSGWTGGIQVNAGALQAASAAALPTGTITVANNSGAALQLNNSAGITVSNALNLSNVGITNAGALENSSGTNTVTGIITLANAAWIGADANTVLNLNGGFSGTNALTLANAGTINISTAPVSAVASLTVANQGSAFAAGLAPGTTALSASSGAFVGALNLYAGTLTISGTGAIGGAGAITAWPGTTLNVIDNSTTPQTNRLGGTRALTLEGGTYNYTGNGSSASSETTTGALTYAWGADVISITNSATLTFGSLANAGGGVLNITTGSGTLGVSTGAAIMLTTSATLTPASVGIIPRATVNGTSFATYSASQGIVPFTAYSAAGNNLDLTSSAGTDTLNLTLTPTWAQSFSKTVNALSLGSGVTLSGAGQTLTLTSGNILVPSGSATIGSGIVTAVGGNEGAFLVNAGSTLNMQGPITASNNLTKGLGGSLVFSAPVYDTTTTSWLSVDGGSVQLNAGNQTLLPGISVAIQPGATFDLNGSAQYITSLTAPTTPGAGSGVAGGSVVSSTGTGTLLVNSNYNFPGQILGKVNFAKAGGNSMTLSGSSNYSGPTLIEGGTVTLQDAGALANTSAVAVNYGATLAINDNGLAGISTRLGAAPVTLNGGSITYTGRAQTVSVENLGPLTLGQGISNINVTAGGTNLNSAQLNFAGINLSNLAATVNIQNPQGQIGSNPTLQFSNTAGLTLVNNILPQFVSNATDFETYIPGLGLAPLNAVGAPGYDNTVIPATSQPAQNIKLAAAATVPNMGGGVFAINSLNLQGKNLTFANAADTLNVTSGGILTNATATLGSTVGNGLITGGGTSGGSVPLYLYGNTGTFTVNSAIVNNAAGGQVELVATVFNGNNLVLANTNNYTGGTVVNGWASSVGTLTIGASGSLPAGGLTINNATVTQTLGGLINPANSVTLNGASSLNLANTAGTLNTITLNNNGGTTNPTVTLTNLLTLSSGSLAATTSNTTVATVTGGTLDFNGPAAAINVAPVTFAGQSVDPWIASLNVASAIRNTPGNSTALTVAGGGNLQLSAQNTYAGGTTVNTSAGSTGLIIGGSSTPNGVGVPVITGPVGTGTLTLGNGAVLISTTANTISNNVAVNGGFTFNGAANNLTLNGSVALAAGNNTINVAAPQVTLTLGGVVSGAGASITKNGYGTLALVGGTSLTGGDTYTGGLTLNSGVLLATGGQPVGTGPITINGGQLQLHSSMGGLYGNNLTINSSLAGAFIDVNSGVANNATNGTLYQLGALNESPATVLNVTGGNNGKLAFTSVSSSLTSASSPATFNVASGVTLILPGGFNSSNQPVNVGQGVLAMSGNNSLSGLTVVAGGTAGIAAQANSVSAPTARATPSPSATARTSRSAPCPARSPAPATPPGD